MYCSKCATPITEGSLKCENCGTTENGGIKKENITYDYKSVEANQKTALEIADCYESLGWELANKNDSYISGNVSLNFRRSRKLKNKEQLNRIQVKLDDAINGIAVLEKRKTQNATIVSIIVGIIGALLFGSSMCLCMPDVFMPEPVLWMYIVGGIFAVTGIIVCALAYLTYKKIRIKSTASMNILIDKKRDEISQLCEDAQRCL